MTGVNKSGDDGGSISNSSSSTSQVVVGNRNLTAVGNRNLTEQEKTAASARVSFGKLCGMFCLYGFCSISMTLINKSIAVYFQYSWTLLLLQALGTVAIPMVGNRVDWFERQFDDEGREMRLEAERRNPNSGSCGKRCKGRKSQASTVDTHDGGIQSGYGMNSSVTESAVRNNYSKGQMNNVIGKDQMNNVIGKDQMNNVVGKAYLVTKDDTDIGLKVNEIVFESEHYSGLDSNDSDENSGKNGERNFTDPYNFLGVLLPRTKKGQMLILAEAICVSFLLWSSFLALKYVSVPLFVVVRNAVPAQTAITEMCISGVSITPYGWIGLILTIIGAYIYTAAEKDIQISYGIAYAFLHTSIAAFTTTLDKTGVRYLKNVERISPMRNNQTRFFLAIPIICCFALKYEITPEPSTGYLSTTRNSSALMMGTTSGSSTNYGSRRTVISDNNSSDTAASASRNGKKNTLSKLEPGHPNLGPDQESSDSDSHLRSDPKTHRSMERKSDLRTLESRVLSDDSDDLSGMESIRVLRETESYEKSDGRKPASSPSNDKGVEEKIRDSIQELKTKTGLLQHTGQKTIRSLQPIPVSEEETLKRSRDSRELKIENNNVSPSSFSELRKLDRGSSVAIGEIIAGVPGDSNFYINPEYLDALYGFLGGSNPFLLFVFVLSIFMSFSMGTVNFSLQTMISATSFQMGNAGNKALVVAVSRATHPDPVAPLSWIGLLISFIGILLYTIPGKKK